jgi:predicted helicase
MNLKPTHKVVKDYYSELEQYKRLGVTHEGAVSTAFQKILGSCGLEHDWTLVTQHRMTSRKKTQMTVDGAFLDEFRIERGYWEAKDMNDDLPTEVKRKFEAGYPKDNIIFQTPERAILWQDNLQVRDANLNDKAQLIDTLRAFFAYSPPKYQEWKKAVDDFKNEVPQIGKSLSELIRNERKSNRTFAEAFVAFYERCRQSLNPNLSEAAVEEMLIQHLLTERIFRTVFSNSDFVHRNAIAREIETVVNALTSQSFSRDDFLKGLNRFYGAIEGHAKRIADFSEKQGFLNAVYEKFFQVFSVKVADTHGIVYTPQPIVEFMVKSVDQILRTEFDRSISDPGVHIIDPFVGTGNFIVRILQEIPKTELTEKYSSELHCNEVMLLPYYIASMNIEHQFFEAVNKYLPFTGICLVDTFDLQENQQMSFLDPVNAQRVEKQKKAPMFVVIGNPPYNMGQVNENDNNKNRKYKTMDERVRETYTADSQAQLRNKLYDPYVKAIRWATDRIGDEGIVAFVTNNGFIDGRAFDGMRKNLAKDFDVIYILDLGGNVRKGSKVSDANVFGIQVGVSISFVVKTKQNRPDTTRIFYYRTDDSWKKEQKFDLLGERQHIGAVKWKPIHPDERYTWLTEGLRDNFQAFIAMDGKNAKKSNDDPEAIFQRHSLGILTSRDILVYSFHLSLLKEQVRTFIDIYNTAVDRRRRSDSSAAVEDYINTNDPCIKWSRQVKGSLKKKN